MLYPEDWKKLPIPDVTLEQQKFVVELVDQILIAKEANIYADISSLEAKVNENIACLYGLTSEENKISKREQN
jgi:adenine-specific DNA-methyltransferase